MYCCGGRGVGCLFEAVCFCADLVSVVRSDACWWRALWYFVLGPLPSHRHTSPRMTYRGLGRSCLQTMSAARLWLRWLTLLLLEVLYRTASVLVIIFPPLQSGGSQGGINRLAYLLLLTRPTSSRVKSFGQDTAKHAPGCLRLRGPEFGGFRAVAAKPHTKLPVSWLGTRLNYPGWMLYVAVS